MIRKLLVGTGALALLFGTATSLGAGVASATPTVQFGGNIHCGVSGNVVFGTPLTNGGASQATVTVRAVLSGCTGNVTQGGVTLTRGILAVSSGTGTITTNCATVLGGAPLPALNGTINWRGSLGHVVASTISISGATTYHSLSPDAVQVGLPTSISAGSFSNAPTTTFSALNSNSSGYLLASRCGALTGLKTIAFGKTAGVVTGGVTIQAGA